MLTGAATAAAVLTVDTVVVAGQAGLVWVWSDLRVLWPECFSVKLGYLLEIAGH